MSAENEAKAAIEIDKIKHILRENGVDVTHAVSMDCGAAILLRIKVSEASVKSLGPWLVQEKDGVTWVQEEPDGGWRTL